MAQPTVQPEAKTMPGSTPGRYLMTKPILGLYNLWGSIGVVILRQIKQCGKNRKQDK